MPSCTCCFVRKGAKKVDIDKALRNLGSSLSDGSGFSGSHKVQLYSYRDLQLATGNFSRANKIGQGGFGSVYKGRLRDGRLVAVKVLSTQSRQGLREFLAEITTISNVEHENLVELYGCCVEEDHRILVYGYLENNSLAETLLGAGDCSFQFSWDVRAKICIGIAEGLAFLHEGVEPHIVHRDIKASNILLDKDLNPKISDFGLAKLFPADLTHISTRIAGTLGYLAPEYAIRGHLTRKADIYSFGVLLLEIVCGRDNIIKDLCGEDQYLLEKVWKLYKKGELEKLVDTSLQGNCNIEEVGRYFKVSLLCTQEIPKLRPSMSMVVKMLRHELDIDEEKITCPGLMSQLFGLKTVKIATSSPSSGESQRRDDSSLHGYTTMSTATMTFTSIENRNP